MNDFTTMFLSESITLLKVEAQTVVWKLLLSKTEQSFPKVKHRHSEYDPLLSDKYCALVQPLLEIQFLSQYSCKTPTFIEKKALCLSFIPTTADHFPLISQASTLTFPLQDHRICFTFWLINSALIQKFRRTIKKPKQHSLNLGPL